jgi:hypothetical protein
MGVPKPFRARSIVLVASVALIAAGCGARQDSAPPPVENTTTMPAPSTANDISGVPVPAPSSAGGVITGTRSGGQPGPNPRPCPAGGFPTAACTGVPNGIQLTDLPLTPAGAYHALKPGEVIDGKHIAGDLVINADNVVVRNSVIDGLVLNHYDGVNYPFTISDSTVGPTSGCHTLPGVGQERYRATRVYIRNHPDGFRISGPDVVVEDSYVKLCSSPGDHSDAIEDYPEGRNVVARHNTFDQRNAPDHTAPIFFTKVPNLVVTDNLVMGGTYSIRVYAKGGGPITVSNNRAVNGLWDYGPVDADCGSINWSGNQLVEIDANYVVTKVVGPLPCG